MLMDLGSLVARYGMADRVSGVLHVGAHLAEEAPTYERLFRDKPVWWVEANPAVIPQIQHKLIAHPRQKVIEALVCDRAGVEMDFHVTNHEGMSSSIFEFGTHPTFSPETVFLKTLQLISTTIDTLSLIYGVTANFLNMDIQGAELLALKGARAFLGNVDFIMSEVNAVEVYVDCCKVEELDAYLTEFQRVETSWVRDQGWGDGFFVRKALL